MLPQGAIHRLNANLARRDFQVKGEGVKIGVLSDSYNNLPGNPALANVLNDDLPGAGNATNPTPVQILQDNPFGDGSDEGRAILQIIHDIAPKSTLAFRTGFISAGDMAMGIYSLQQAGCQVIVDDVTYITEPFFQDGIISQAVDSVTNLGVSYFTSAGNYGNLAYSGAFNPTTAPYGITGQAHNYGGGSFLQNINLTPGDYTIVMQWQDSIYSQFETAGTQNDLDIFLTYDNGKTLFGFNRNNIGGDPIEVLPFTVTSNAQANIMVVRAAGTQNVNFKYIVFRGNLTFNNFNQGTSTIVGQANSAGAMTCAAVRVSQTPAFGVNPPVIESFSSIGGTPVYGVVRNKPDFAGPDGVMTTVNFGNLSTGPFPTFYGTSCATPHVAAAAALLLSGKQKFYGQNISPAQMRTLLQSTSVGYEYAGL